MTKQMFWKSLTRKYYTIGGPGDDGGDGGDGGNVTKIEVVLEKDETGREYYKTPDGKRLLTQEHMNVEIGNARVGERKKVQEELKVLQRLKDNAATSESVKAELENQMESLRAQLLTEKQQLEIKLQAVSKEAETKIKSLEDERTDAIQRWQGNLIDNTLMQNALTEDAVTPSQLCDLLRGATKVQEVVDENGKPTGNYQVVTSIPVTGEDGVTVVKTLPTGEAMKEMKKSKSNWNLFNTTMRTGAGGAPSPKLTTQDLGSVKSLKDYQTARTGLMGQ